MSREKRQAAFDAIDVFTGAPLGNTHRLVHSVLHQRRAKREQQAYDEFLRQVAIVAEIDPGPAVEEEVQAIIDDASAETLDLLFDGFSAMLAAIDESAAPYIARLTAEYAINRKPRDDFFRRVGRVLADCSRHDTEALGAITQRVRHALLDESELGATHDITITIRDEQHIEVSHRNGHAYEFPTGPVQDAFDLLTRNRLGRVYMTGKRPAIRFDEAKRETLERLIRLFALEPPRK